MRKYLIYNLFIVYGRSVESSGEEIGWHSISTDQYRDPRGEEETNRFLSELYDYWLLNWNRWLFVGMMFIVFSSLYLIVNMFFNFDKIHSLLLFIVFWFRTLFSIILFPEWMMLYLPPFLMTADRVYLLLPSLIVLPISVVIYFEFVAWTRFKYSWEGREDCEKEWELSWATRL